jgi:hypothetical protein
LLIANLTSPFGFHLGGVDDDHLRIFGDGVLRNGVLQFLVGLLGDEAVDLLTALLRLLLEVAFLDPSVRARLGGLNEFLLSPIALIDDDGRGGLDFGFLVLSGLLLLNRILTLEAVLQSGVSLLRLLLAQTGAGDALELAFRITARSLLNGGQSQLDGGRRNDGVLVVVLLFRLLVQFGGQGAVGLFELLQQMILSLALVFLLLVFLLLLLLALILILATSALVLLVVVVVLILLLLSLSLLPLVFVVFVAGLVAVFVVVVHAQALLVALALLLLLIGVVLILVVLIVRIVFVLVVVGNTLSTVITLLLLLLLWAQRAKHAVKAVFVAVIGAGYRQAESDHDEETHYRDDSNIMRMIEKTETGEKGRD